ncbi:general stress protein [Virgibacillus dakarensis]|uniref:General stress protein 17M n=1 Tax=Lentibacillus populi TaxID=1827502 RepID=A0A9W5TZ99_9BACI|nr:MULTISPECIES: general stress protein [Bacillaceae]MBT2218289.1 general stress protein [Virgibacillus dakarensis]MTW87841.1 general stress protein [Virgibacillus dakarensis]GGB50432.1 general stress protein 17M [Lentibacillus populi]
MKPIVKEFQDDTALMTEVKELSAKGIHKDNLYVMSHDADRTNRVAEKVDANKVGVSEEGLGTAVGNIFRKKGDELRQKFKELGFAQHEANELEEKLDHGKILLIVNQAS